MNYLITGATGNLARQIVAYLEERGHEVLQMDLNDPPGEAKRFEQGNITDSALMERLVSSFKPERILHMASLLSMTSEANPELAWSVNASASFRLLELAEQYRVRQFFYPSTCATYAGTLPEPLPEDFPQWPTNIYGVTKVAIERMGNYFAAQRGVDFRALRFPMVLSLYAPPGAVSAYASHAFRAAARGDRFVFPVEPELGMSTIYATDVVTGVISYMDAPADALTQRVYNIHAFSPTAREIAEAIAKRVPGFSYEFDPQEINMRVLGPLPRVHDDARARRDWGWSPAYDLDACAEEMLEQARREEAS